MSSKGREALRSEAVHCDADLSDGGVRREKGCGPMRAISRLLTGAALISAAALAGADAALAEGGSLRKSLAVDASESKKAATLEADEINYDPKTEIVRASGNVKVFYAGRVLRADSIVYDARSNRISAQGKITVINPDGSVIVADEAKFDTEIRDGLIRGARAVLADGRSRIAAVEGRRVDGKVTSMSKAVYSPCEVCAKSPTPLWRIRARRIVHDEEAKRITYDDATFEVAGIPVAWLPFFSHADPTVKRKSGFLTPSVTSDDELGTGAAISYYWAIAANRDLTATAFAYTKENPVFAGEYRALETWGAFKLAGSITWSDDAIERGLRGHFDGRGVFSLGSGFVAGFDSLIASDDTYLRRYDFNGSDRATTRLFVENFGERGFVAVEAARYQSFRTDEFAGSLPQILPHFDGERVMAAPIVGGEFIVRGDALWLQRTQGRDVGRVSAEIAWERAYVSAGGFVLDATLSARGDLYSIQDDEAIKSGSKGRFLPLAALKASYPLGKVTKSASHVIEPIGVFVAAPYGGDDPTKFANEDSQDFELDELSIFAIKRITGLDRWEDGPRATIGVRYKRDAFGDGVDVEVAIGQSYRFKDSTVFSDSSGLRDQISDFVGAWRLSAPGLYTIGHRFRITDEGTLKRNEVYAALKPLKGLRLDGSFVHIAADQAIDADTDRTEGIFDAEYDITRYWTVTGSVRRDFEASRFVSASGGLRYADECLEVDLKVGRRFNSVEDAPASTKFDIKVRLLGVDGY
ncbi:MAG: LPS assembly protein LptD [Neomegalonema sp.]|nr:LPS assembly protein LptD [Neomegalonema sp.]